MLLVTSQSAIWFGIIYFLAIWCDLNLNVPEILCNNAIMCGKLTQNLKGFILELAVTLISEWPLVVLHLQNIPRRQILSK